MKDLIKSMEEREESLMRQSEKEVCSSIRVELAILHRGFSMALVMLRRHLAKEGKE